MIEIRIYKCEYCGAEFENGADRIKQLVGE